MFKKKNNIIILLCILFIFSILFKKDKILNFKNEYQCCFYIKKMFFNKSNINNYNINKNYYYKYNYKYFNNRKYIKVNTDMFILKINTFGGNIDKIYLKNYLFNINETYNNKNNYIKPKFIYKIKNNLIEKNNFNNFLKNKKIVFFSKKNIYLLNNNKNKLFVPMIGLIKKNIFYTKTFIFNRNNYSIKILHNINNISNKSIYLKLFGQLKQSMKSNNIGFINKILNNSNKDIMISINNKLFNKYKFKNFKKIYNNYYTDSVWISILYKYFVSVIIPLIYSKKIFYTKYINNKKLLLVGFISKNIFISKKSKYFTESLLWIGPKLQDKMLFLSKNLDFTVDYGLFWFIARPLFKLFKYIFNITNSWGLSIIIITCIVRSFMYKIAKIQYISTIKTKILQPKILKIKNNINNNTIKYFKKVFLLYKKENINPLNTIFASIIQIPFFLSLYCMLSHCIEFYNIPFGIWIKNLTIQDPYYILPVIMGFTICMVQTTSINNMLMNLSDQNNVILLPMIFTVFFLHSPVGLILYYITNNVIIVIQQILFYKIYKIYF